MLDCTGDDGGKTARCIADDRRKRTVEVKLTVTFKQDVMVWLAAALFSSAVASGRQAEKGDAPGQNRPTTLPAQSPLTPDRLFALASPAVVKLTIKDEDDREIGIASGFIVKFQKGKFDIQGQSFYDVTIITNYHVIRPAINIDVSFSDKESGWVSKVIAEDESADLAVLLASSLVKPKLVLKLRENVSPPVGTKVYAIGSPQGLSNSLSEGLISGYRKRGKHEPWIQITAPISPGSSGGPLFSPEGWVIGVTTAFLGKSQNLNFAVPASEVSRLLTHTEKQRRIWEGASLRETEDTAYLLARLSMHLRFSKKNPKKWQADESGKAFESFLTENVRKKDQCALLLRGRELYFDKEYDEAIVMLRRATKAEPGEYAYLTNYALAQAIHLNVFAASKRVIDLEDAVELLKRAKELNPEFGPTFHMLSETYHTLGKYPEVLIEAESLVRLMPRCYVGYQLRGEAWAELGRQEAFERDFETACDLRPNDHYLLVHKGLGYAALGQLQKAVETYQDAIKIDENSFVAHNNLGATLGNMGKYDEAIKSYQRSIKSYYKATKAAGDAGYTSWQSDMERRIAECRRQMRQSP